MHEIKKENHIGYTGPLENNDKHGHLKLKLGVSGAAETGHCGLDALDKAKELGREIIRQGSILVTGLLGSASLRAALGTS